MHLCIQELIRLSVAARCVTRLLDRCSSCSSSLRRSAPRQLTRHGSSRLRAPLQRRLGRRWQQSRPAADTKLACWMSWVLSWTKHAGGLAVQALDARCCYSAACGVLAVVAKLGCTPWCWYAVLCKTNCTHNFEESCVACLTSLQSLQGQLSSSEGPRSRGKARGSSRRGCGSTASRSGRCTRRSSRCSSSMFSSGGCQGTGRAAAPALAAAARAAAAAG